MRVPGPGTAVLLAMCHFVALDWLSWEAVVLIKTTSKMQMYFCNVEELYFMMTLTNMYTDQIFKDILLQNVKNSESYEGVKFMKCKVIFVVAPL